jgi:hypothetical protein
MVTLAETGAAARSATAHGRDTAVARPQPPGHNTYRAGVRRTAQTEQKVQIVSFPSSNQRPAPANQSSKLAVHQRGLVSGLSAHGQCRVPWSVTTLPSSFFTLIPSRSNPLPSVSSGVFRNPES